MSSICSSSPCTLDVATPGITSITRSKAGYYAINFANGTYSAAPSCTFVAGPAGYFATRSNVPNPETPTKYEFAINTNAGAFDNSFDLVCVGPK